MKINLTILFLLGSIFCFSQRFSIETKHPIEIRVWKDSKLIHDHKMNPGDNLVISDIGDGILIQWTGNGVTYADCSNLMNPYNAYCDGKYMCQIVNHDTIKYHSKWFRPLRAIILHFGQQPTDNSKA